MEAPKDIKRAIRRAAALVLVILSGVGFFYFQGSFSASTAALLIGLFAAFVVAPHSTKHPQNPKQQELQRAIAEKPWLWIVGIAFIIVSVGAFFWLFPDATTGYNNVYPVYIFAFSALVCGIWWAGIFARWVQSRWFK